MKPYSSKSFEIEEDLRTLITEREIRKDPKRFKAAQQLARKKLAGLKKVASGKREVPTV